MTKSKKQLDDLVDLLDDLPVDDDEAARAMAAHGIDANAWASEVAAMVRQKTFERWEAERQADLARRASLRQKEPIRGRESQLGIFRALVARAPEGFAMHFHKYEAAPDEELAEAIADLRELLGDDETE